MASDVNALENSNPSLNPSIHDISAPARRTVLQGGLSAALGMVFSPLSSPGASSVALSLAALSEAATAAQRTGVTHRHSPLLGFASVPVSTADTVVVPEGYTAEVIAAWGEPVGLPDHMPAFKVDASNSAADQEAQIGMHHDGMHFFPLPAASRQDSAYPKISKQSSSSGLLVMNHEYVDEGLLFKDGLQTWTLEKVRKSQAAHGVSVIEIAWRDGHWQMVRPSRWARRITANTPMAFGGPATGHPLLRTAADPLGRQPLGTFNNCASGITPWGTYLTCEENFIGYFKGSNKPSAHERRWGLNPRSGYRWEEHDERFDAVKHPNEPHRFGWVVEIDPYNPQSTPVKRTALGRAAHEGATTTVTRDGRAVVYMGEDARFEYIYKFVSRDKIQPGGAAANAELLNHGTLYVAKFNADGRGEWLALRQGQGPLTPANGWADQGDVLIKTRQASDLLGGTKMDRPEWISIDHQGWVYCSLTNNSSRGGDAQPAVDAANPRANNSMGHIIRWKEDGDFHAEHFAWNHFVLAGDPTNERPEAQGNIQGDVFACPDGLWTDSRGVLWIQCDMSSSVMGQGEHAHLGHNAMLAADVHTGEIRRFLTGPTGCEITGATGTPDGRTLFVNIQHPGETPAERSDPNAPGKHSHWPHGHRPRSATVVIRKKDGGVIGT